MAKLNYKKIFALGVIAVIFAIIGWVLPITTSTNQTVGVEWVLNTTNLAPSFPGEPVGTNERVDNVTYWANSTPIEIHAWAHANSANSTAGVFLYINNTLYSPRAGRPLGVAENAYRGVDTTIPKGSYYRVDFENYHHYEWRETSIITGNVTSNTTDDDSAYVQKSGSTWTGNMIMDGTTINTNTVGDKDAYIYMDSGIPTIRMRSRSVGTSGYFELFPSYADILVSGRRYNFTSTSLDMGNATITNVGIIQSTVTTGTAPLTIQSTTLNTNLNADLLDGLHASQITCSDCVTHAELNAKANISYMVVDQWQIGNDSQVNFTTSQQFVSNSTHVYLNGLKKRLFYDYNETSHTSVNITATLAENDLLEVEYEKIQ